MNILINYDFDSCTASITGDSTLTEIAFAVETVASHFLGRGVNRFDCTRKRQENGNCILVFKALKKSGPMVLSKVASIGCAVEENVFPKNIPAGENFKLEENGFEKIITEGQHKHGSWEGRFSQQDRLIVNHKKDGNYTTTIVESFLLRPELPFAILTYGLGDMFTGLFALKCHYVKWQGSLDKVQLYIRHKLTDEQLNRFLLSNSDYNVQQKVSTLS